MLGQVLREGMVLAAAGVVCGLAGALAAGRTTIALAACYVPARRAARLDPMRALRYE